MYNWSLKKGGSVFWLIDPAEGKCGRFLWRLLAQARRLEIERDELIHVRMHSCVEDNEKRQRGGPEWKSRKKEDSNTANSYECMYETCPRIGLKSANLLIFANDQWKNHSKIEDLHLQKVKTSTMFCQKETCVISCSCMCGYIGMYCLSVWYNRCCELASMITFHLNCPKNEEKKI